MTTTDASKSIDLTQEADFSLGVLRVMPSSREVTDGTQREALEPRVMQVLVALSRHRDEVVTRDQLIALCWEGRVVGDDAVNRCVARIRRLSETHGGFSVETISRLGYRLSVYPDTRIATRAAATAAATESNPEVEPLHRAGSAVPQAKSRQPARTWGVVAVIAIAAMVGLFVYNARTPEPTPAARLRLAVLPFENLSPDPQNAFFTDGMHEEVLSTLASRATSIEVISRTTMMSYRDRRTTIAELADALRATHVLEGSVRRDGQQVKLTLQLIDARNDKHMWSRDFERTLQSAITLQADVAADVAAQLSARLITPTSTTPLTSDPEAYDLYLKAGPLMPNAGEPVARFDEMESLLTRALALDPAFARAYIRRAGLYVRYFALNMDTSERRLTLIRADIEAARKYSPGDPMVDAMEGLLKAFADVDTAAALEKIEPAAGRGDPSALFSKALLLSSAGRYAESTAILEQLAQVDPRNRLNLMERIGNFGNEGRFADALALARNSPDPVPLPVLRSHSFARKALPRAMEFTVVSGLTNVRSQRELTAASGDPVFALTPYFNLARIQRRYQEMKDLLATIEFEAAHPGSFEGYSVLAVGQRPVAEYRAWTELLLGNRARAAEHGRAVLQFASRQPKNTWNAWFVHMLEAEAHMFMNDKAAAFAAMESSLRSPPSGDNNLYTSRYRSFLAAVVLAWIGKQDEAVALLERLASTPPIVAPGTIMRDPMIATPLRDNERYRSLVAKLEADITRNQALFASIPEAVDTP